MLFLASGCPPDDPARAPVLDAVADEAWRAGGFEEHGGLLVVPVAAVDAAGRHVVVVDRDVEESVTHPFFTVRRMTMEGDTVAVHRYPYEPIAMREEWVQGAAWDLVDGLIPDSARAMEIAMGAVHAPAWLPPVTDVRVGVDGGLWLQREEVPGAEERRWQIIDPDGTDRGTVRVPSRLSIRAVHGGAAWAVEETDEEGDGRANLWRLEVSSGVGAGDGEARGC